MNRESAMTVVLAEAFSESGLAMLVQNGGDPGWARIDNLVRALDFLTGDLAGEDSFGREFVSAIFALGARVPEAMRAFHPEGERFRPSLHDQAEELAVAVTALVENWSHWPDWETRELRTYRLESPGEEGSGGPGPEEVGGYRPGDITYCAPPGTAGCFPVRVDRLGNGYLEVTPYAGSATPYPEAPSGFDEETANRRFFYPVLSPGARFGGDDERLVNSQRVSGPELRLLPVTYASVLFDLVRERHATDPARWPLPTGLLFERWFQRGPDDQAP
jgi:hypothetical protein